MSAKPKRPYGATIGAAVVMREVDAAMPSVEPRDALPGAEASAPASAPKAPAKKPARAA